jgi:hypothetical protein
LQQVDPVHPMPPHCAHSAAGLVHEQVDELEAGAEDDELLVLEAEEVIVEDALDDLLEELDTDELDTVEELLLEEVLETVELRVELCVVLDCVGSQFGVVPVPEMQNE